MMSRQKTGRCAALVFLLLSFSFRVEAQENGEPVPIESTPAPTSAPKQESAHDPEQEVEMEDDVQTDDEDTEYLDAVVERIRLHGFISQGFMISTDNNYMANTESGTFEFTEIGVNISAELTDSLRGGIQLLSYDLGDEGNYDITLDWAFLEYRPFNWFGLRVGRIKNPHGLYGESMDVDAARVPVLLPQGMYTPEIRYFFHAFPGISAFGSIPIDPLGSIEYNVYGGKFNDFTIDDGVELKGDYVVGGQIIWETPLPGLRLGGDLARTLFVITTDTSATDTQPIPISIKTNFPVWRWAGFIEFNAYNILLSAEYGRFVAYSEPEENDLITMPSYNHDGFYFMGAYSFTEWFQAASYYSLHFLDIYDRRGKSERFLVDHHAWQKDLAFTLRFDVNEFWLIKLEGHYIDGTSSFALVEPTDTDILDLKQKWGLFLIKTTLSF